MNIMVKQILTIITIILFAGCGSGDDTTNDNQSTKTVKLTIALQGNEAASVKGIQTTITLPTGVQLNAATNGELPNGAIPPSTGTPPGTLAGKYTAAANGAPATVTIAFITTGTMTAGDLVTLTADLPAGVSVPTAGEFTISSRFVGADGKKVDGASLVLR